MRRQIGSDVCSCLQQRGNAYHALGQHERAIRDYEEATRLDPSDEGACYIPATVLEHHDSQKALRVWGKYLPVAKVLPPGRGWIQTVLEDKKAHMAS